MSISPVFALGLLAQSIFVGGNVGVSGIFLPTIRQSEATPNIQVKLWGSLYDKAAKLFASSAFTSFVCYMYLAYHAGAGNPLRQTAIISGLLSLSAVPFTFIVIMGTVKKLKSYAAMDNATLVELNYGGVIDYWNKLSIARTLVFAAGFANSLYYLVKY